MKTIVTQDTGNPTPERSWDYVAYYKEDEGENDGVLNNCAYGRTPQEAIKNFKENQEEI